jgi:hypothetical protein
MSTIWFTRDQALAWVTWRDEESVARVGPKGDVSYRALARRRELYAPADAVGSEIDRDAKGGSVICPTLEAATEKRAGIEFTAEGYDLDQYLLKASVGRHSLRALVRYDQPVEAAIAALRNDLLARYLQFRRHRRRQKQEEAARETEAAAPSRRGYPPRFGSPDDLYQACADGRVKAHGRFDGGRMQLIPPTEWACGKLPQRWTEIVFKVGELRRKFPAAPCNTLAMPGNELRQAPERAIHEAITAAYDQAGAAGEKPPNLKEIVAPAQAILRVQGYKASGRQIQNLAGADQHNNRRRKPGATLASEKRRLQP